MTNGPIIVYLELNLYVSCNNLKGKNEYISICDDKIMEFYNSWYYSKYTIENITIIFIVFFKFKQQQYPAVTCVLTGLSAVDLVFKASSFPVVSSSASTKYGDFCRGGASSRHVTLCR